MFLDMEKAIKYLKMDPYTKVGGIMTKLIYMEEWSFLMAICMIF